MLSPMLRTAGKEGCLRIGVIASILLFTLACCLPAVESGRGISLPENGQMQVISSHTQTVRGAAELAGGWIGILGGVVTWYANPFWALAVLFAFLRMRITAAVLGMISTAIGCTVFLLVGRELSGGDEGGVTTQTIVRLLPGCYLWLASLAAVPLAAGIEGRAALRQRKLSSEQ